MAVKRSRELSRAMRSRLVCGLCLAACATAPPAAAAQRILAISSADTEPYRLAMSGMSGLGASVERFQVAAERDQAIAGAVARGGRDTAIVTLGAAAAAAVAGAKVLSAGVPVVNCMVLGTTPARAGAAIGVPLAIPADVHATWLRRLLPAAHTVGILYDPAQNEERAADSVRAMAHAGLAVVAEAVPDPAALPVALQRMQDHVDVLHALPDTTVYNREHARALLLFSFRQRIPLVGPTEGWVKAGALFAVDWDYADLGRYCAALALRQLAGAKGPLPPPPQTRVVVNARSAEQLHIRWDAQQLQLIDKVYP